MTTKFILFSNGDKIAMTFEEVREQFTPMVIRTMNRANNKFVYNPVETDDFKQELDIELWRAYEDYDPETGNCFTTYLFYKLQKGVRNATFHRYAQKNQHNGLYSMNAPMGEDDLKLEDMFSTNDNTMDALSVHELTAIIRENVTEDEEDALLSLLNRTEFTVQDYADKYGITRQAANARILRLKRKLQKIVAQQYLEIA